MKKISFGITWNTINPLDRYLEVLNTLILIKTDAANSHNLVFRPKYTPQPNEIINSS